MKKAIRPCCTLFLLTASVALSQSAKTSGNASTEANLQKMELELSQGDVARDPAPFNKYLDEEIIALGPGWNDHGRAEVVKDIQSSPCTIANPVLSAFAYKWISPDVVLVSYKLKETVTCDGKTTQSAEDANSLWQKKNGKWMAVFHQSTAYMPGTMNAAQ